LAAAPVSRGQSMQAWHAKSAIDVFKFAATGARSSFTRLGTVPAVGILFAVVLAAGFGLLYKQRGSAVLHGRTAIPIALFVGALVCLVLTGIARANNSGALYLQQGTGTAFARSGKFSYVVIAMMLPAFALAVDALIARWQALGVFAVAVFVLGVPSHIQGFRDDAQEFARLASAKNMILSAARLPLAHDLPRSLHTGLLGSGPTMGWLLENVPSGRIPAGMPLTRDQIATATLTLALQDLAIVETLAPQDRVSAKPVARCSGLTRPAIRVLQKGDVLTLRTGSANLVYLAPNGGVSQPFRLTVGRNLVALAGPLRLQLVSSRPREVGPTVFCT
jgi:hypothetical protein